MTKINEEKNNNQTSSLFVIDNKSVMEYLVNYLAVCTNDKIKAEIYKLLIKLIDENVYNKSVVSEEELDFLKNIELTDQIPTSFHL